MKYYCKDCGCQFDESELVPGWTKSVDCYKNDTCQECGSEELSEISDNDLCPVCGDVMDGDWHMVKDCAKEILKSSRFRPYGNGYGLPGDLWAIKFINEAEVDNVYRHNGVKEFNGTNFEYMEFHELTIRDYIVDNAEAFVRYVSEVALEKDKEEKKFNAWVNKQAQKAIG